jgi:hypothetical protein
MSSDQEIITESIDPLPSRILSRLSKNMSKSILLCLSNCLIFQEFCISFAIISFRYVKMVIFETLNISSFMLLSEAIQSVIHLYLY